MMHLRQESAHRCGNNLHLLKGFSGQAPNVRVAGQQARREAEGEVYRNVGRRRMENDTFSEAIIHIVDFRFFLQKRRPPAPEAEGRHVRIFPHLPKLGRKVIQEGNHVIIEGAQGFHGAHTLGDFGRADDVLQFVKILRHRYRCTP